MCNCPCCKQRRHLEQLAHKSGWLVGVNYPPANPTTLGNVWIGMSRPTPEMFAELAALNAKQGGSS